jgi:hypothetical protein
MFLLKIKPDDGEPFEVETTSRDIAKWERGGTKTAPRSMGRLADDLRMTDMTDLAWYAASRRGLTQLDIVAWRDGVDLDFTKLTEDDDDETEDGQPEGDGSEGGPT